MPSSGHGCWAAVASLVFALAAAPRPAVAAPIFDVRITINLPSGNGQFVSFFDSTHDLAGTVDSGSIGTGDGDVCPATLGPGYSCGRGFAHGDIAYYLAGTQPNPLPITVLTLEALAKLQVHDAPAVHTLSVDARARVDIAFGCYESNPALTRSLVLNARFDGTQLATTAPAGITQYTTRFLNSPATCGPGGGHCHTASSPLKCDGSRTTQSLTLEPLLYILNDDFLSGWNADITLDASHTMTIESIDVVDDQQQPVAGARAWMADDAGQPLGYFLRSDEVGVVQPIGPTPTATSATPTPTPTAATPVPCATLAKPKLTLGKILAPVGDDTLAFAGLLPLATTARDPDAGGLQISLNDGSGPITDVTLPPGLFDKATKTGWKVNKKRTKWAWTHPKAGAPSGVVKAVVATKKTDVAIVVKAGQGAFAAAPPLTVTLAFPLNGDCGTTSFAGVGQACVTKSKGKTVVCK